jgi:penicillin-binding protein 1A
LEKLIALGEKIDKWLYPVRAVFGKNSRSSMIMRMTLILCVVLLMLFLGVYAWIYSTVPSRKSFLSLRTNNSSIIYSGEGKVLGKFFLQDRTNVALEEISPDIVNSLIATEDVRFYKHHGIDRRGMFRVFFKTLLMGNESSGGGSTITQQLAKNLYPRKRYPFLSLPLNKLREAIIAEKLEDVFSKEEILMLYLNTVPFGENAFGIEVASRRFFNKSAKSLKMEEAATLVGMLKATSNYNPRRHPEASLKRRNIVLEQLSKYGYISLQVKDSVQALPLVVNYKFIDHNKGLATYFREQLRQEMEAWCDANPKEDGSTYNIYTDGLKIYTTIDYQMQEYAEQAMGRHMKKLQNQFFLHWGKRKPWGKDTRVVTDAMKRSALYKRLKEDGSSDEDIKKAFATPSKTRVFSWNGIQERTMTPMDSLNYYLKFLHAGFVAMDVKTGEVKAWVGGLNHEYFKYDHVNTRSKRQVGSTFKPIVYAAALEAGISPCEYFPNEKKTYSDYNNWSPANADNSYGGSYSMAGALTNSVNTVSAQIIMRAGIENVVELARRMGISSPLDPVPSLSLGTADLSLLEMVSAYAVFPNNGYYTKPSYIKRIETSDGKVIADFTRDRQKQAALSGYNASVMVNMMESVVNSGTASRLRYEYGLTIPVGGKTGTTQSHADGWFIGFTPDIVAGVWVGAEDRRVHFRSLDLGQGASMALPIWGEFMKRVLSNKKYAQYKKSKFRQLPETVAIQLNCAPYIAPDSNNFWNSIFGGKRDSIREQERIIRRQEREVRRTERIHRRREENNDGFWNIFRRRR